MTPLSHDKLISSMLLVWAECSSVNKINIKIIKNVIGSFFLINEPSNIIIMDILLLHWKSNKAL